MTRQTLSLHHPPPGPHPEQSNPTGLPDADEDYPVDPNNLDHSGAPAQQPQHSPDKPKLESFPEDEDMDPVGELYPDQESLNPDSDPLDVRFSPDNEPDIPDGPKSECGVQSGVVKP